VNAALTHWVGAAFVRPGYAVDLVHYSPLFPPRSPNQPR